MLYSPTVYRLMNKKSSEFGTARDCSRDRTFQRRPILPLERKGTTLSLKEKLLLLHFHENGPENETGDDSEIIDDPKHANDSDGIRNRRKFERSITAPDLPLRNASATGENSEKGPGPAIRKKSEGAQPSRTKQQGIPGAVKQVIGGCCCKVKRGLCIGKTSTTSGSMRSGSTG